MKLHPELPSWGDRYQEMAKLVRALVVVGRRLMTALTKNPVASNDEVEQVAKNLDEVTRLVRDVLMRTARVDTINENAEFYKLSDAEMAAKLKGLELDLGHAVAVVTTALERLHQTRHVSAKEYQTLRRYWMTVPVQYHQLRDRWQTATAL